MVRAPEPEAPALPRVLIVDDNELTRELETAALEPLAAELVCVPSGELALAELRRREYAVVLLDISMPGLDGFDTAAQMKRDPQMRHVPIIFVTGEIDESRIRRGYDIGAADYLLKPFDPEILRTKVGVFVELARLRLQAQQLSHRALHDPLTGLPNRTLFLDRLELALARSGRDGRSIAVLFLDLDEFKHINDTLGHAAGDHALVEAAARMQSVIRSSDTAARYGGDEFLILCEYPVGTDNGHLAERLVETFERPLTIDGIEVQLEVSIGEASTRDRTTSPEDLIEAADAQMLAAKVRRRRQRWLARQAS